MKKFVAMVLAATMCFSVAGCAKEQKEWNYEELEKEFGGIIETDCVSVRDCLNILSWEDYYVSGYVVDVNILSPDILKLSEDLDGKTSFQITVLQGGDNQYFAKVGETVYVKAENTDSFDENYYLSSNTVNLKDGYVSAKKLDDSYLSVLEFIRLMDKIYKDTYFRTTGIIMQDGENYDGTPRYYLYPSEDSYKEDKLTRVELSFLEEQTNIVGKTVTVVGNPDKNATFQGLTNCSIVEEK